MIRYGSLVLSVVAAAVVFASGESSAQQATKPQAQWPQLSGASDLPLDPSVTLGVLPNGLRYLIQKTDNSAGRVAMRLVINAGSMQEQPDQRGLAHFIEHMAFRGSTNVADGEMVKRLERLGVRPGADVNAATGPAQTFYKFNFSRNDSEALETGLSMLREVAANLTFDPIVALKEKDVVLAEMRMRDQPMQAFQMTLLAETLGDHPYARSPGGEASIVEAVSVRRMRDFYDAYYRPERSAVLVVGDIDPKWVEQAIAARFAGWRGHGAAGGDPAPIMTNPAKQPFFVNTVNGMPTATLLMRWFEPYKAPEMTKAQRRRTLIEGLGDAILSIRVTRQLEDMGKPAQSVRPPSRTRITGVENGWAMTAAGVNDLDKTMSAVLSTWRQAQAQGVTQEELHRAIEVQRAALARASAGPSQPPAEPLADALVEAAGRGDGVYVSRADNNVLYEQLITTVTLAEVNAYLKQPMPGAPLVIYSSGTELPGGVAALKAAYEKAMAAPVSSYAAQAVKPWPYTDFGAPGKVVSRNEDPGLGVTMVEFENGARLTIKPVASRPNDVAVRVRFGLGRLGKPSKAMDASDYALWIWRNGGLNKLTLSEQRETLRKDFVSSVTSEADDAFIVQSCIGGCVTPQTLDRQLQLFAAMFTDPAYRSDDWEADLKRTDDAERTMPATAASVAQFNLPRLLHSDDIRWTFNTSALRRSWKPEDAAAWMRPVVAQSPLEIIVVGDIRVDDVIASVGKTLGALPPRKAQPEPKGVRDVKFPAPTPSPIVLTHKGAANQAVVYVYWPTPDVFDNARQHRIRLVLSRILQIKASGQVRVANGNAYAPSATLYADRNIQGYGYIGFSSDATPEAADSVIAKLEAVAAEVAAGDVSEDELQRALGPQIEAVKREQTQAPFWFSNLDNAQTDPRVLASLRTALGDFAGIRIADVVEEAKRWLKPKTAWKMKVVPEKSAAAGSR